ncbi:MAG: hypothetical protein ACREJM_00795, partial [Candidatus Saccharimonadales bacterium]
MGELDPALQGQGQDPALTFDRNRGEAAAMAVAAALTAGVTATAGAMAAEATPAYANVPALYAPLVPGQETQTGPLFIERHPYGNPVAEASTGSTPPDATSRQECINDALAPIDVVNAKLRRPNHNGKGQKAFARLITERMPLNCLSDFNVGQDLRIAFKVGGVPFLGINLNIGDAGYINGGVNKVVRLPGLEPPTKWQLTRGIYKCTPGSKKTDVKFLTREIAMDPRSYGVTNWDTIDQKTFKPIPVTHILGGAC